MADLFDPRHPGLVHFMGVAGAGMSGLALVARRRGVGVSGCDTDGHGVAQLTGAGIGAVVGHDPAHLEGVRAMVVSAAIPTDHPELRRAAALGIPVVPRKRALAEVVASGRVIAVSGTHGKTTTTVMITEALAASGFDPTGIAGGRVSAWGGNARVGRDDLHVVEADEFDQAFLELDPDVAVVTNVEPEHLECYGSVEALEGAFATFAGRASTVVLAADDPGTARLAGRLSGPRVVRYGIDEGDVAAESVEATPTGTRAAIRLPDGGRVTLWLRVPGRHNLLNALAAVAVGHVEGAPLDRVLESLAAFGGVGRRFERLGEVKGIEIVDDYAHHPSEVAATLAAARQAFPGRRLMAVFQPHLYSRTAREASALGRALAAADLVIVTDVYAAREQPMPGITGALVADASRQAGAETVYEPTRATLGQRVLEVARAGDVILTLGAGDITRVGRELAHGLTAA